MKRSLALNLLALTLLVASPAALYAGDDIGRLVLDEIGRSRAGAILWQIVKWVALGAFAGIALGVVAFFLIRALGGYRWQWRNAKWFRLLTFLLLLFLCPILLGTAGCMEGIGRGSEIALRESQIGTDLLPQAGAYGADLVVMLYLIAPQLDQGQAIDFGAGEAAKLEQFRAGQWQLDVADLSKRVDKLSAEGAQKVADRLKDEALTQLPSWKGGIGEDILDWLLPALSRRLIERKGKETLDQAGVPPFLHNLVDESKKQDGQKMTQGQLTGFMTQRVIVPAMLQPVHGYTGGTQKTMFILLALVFVLPIVGFRVAEYVRVRRCAAQSDVVAPKQL
jgi:hypothetical protein